MNKYKITVNRGYNLGDTKFNIYDTTIGFITSGIVIFGIDNNMELYSSENDELQIIKIESDMETNSDSNEISFSIPPYMNTEFKKNNLFYSVGIKYAEKELLRENNKNYITLFMYPFIVEYNGTEKTIYPILKVYDNYNVIISYNILLKNEIDDNMFVKDFACINRIKFDKIYLPLSYFSNKDNEKKEYIRKIDGENIRYIDFSNIKKFSNLRDITDYILSLFLRKYDTGIYYVRTTYYINKNDINNENIKSLLIGIDNTPSNYKIENNRSILDYKHYFNECCTVITSNKNMDGQYDIQIIEEEMINDTLGDVVLYNNIKMKKYKYDELKDIYNNFIDKKFDNRFSHYGEINDTFEKLHEYMKRSERIESIKEYLDQSKKEKEMYYQDKITLFILFLSISPLVDYIISPLIKILLNSNEKLILLKNTIVAFLGNTNAKDYFSILCFVLSSFLISIVYGYINKIKK